MIYRMAPGRHITMVMGSACAEVTKTLAEIVPYWNLILVSGISETCENTHAHTHAHVHSHMRTHRHARACHNHIDINTSTLVRDPPYLPKNHEHTHTHAHRQTDRHTHVHTRARAHTHTHTHKVVWVIFSTTRLFT